MAAQARGAGQEGGRRFPKKGGQSLWELKEAGDLSEEKGREGWRGVHSTC